MYILATKSNSFILRSQAVKVQVYIYITFFSKCNNLVPQKKNHWKQSFKTLHNELAGNQQL